MSLLHIQMTAVCVASIAMNELVSARQTVDRRIVVHEEQASTVQQSVQFWQCPVGLMIPQPICTAEIERYRRILGLSEEQAKYLEYLFENYRDKVAALQRSRLPGLIPLAELFGERLDSQQYDPEMLLIAKSFFEGQSELRNASLGLETDLLDGLASVLAIPQAEFMDRVRMHRRRASCVLLPVRIPSAGVDLVHLIEEMDLGDEVLSKVDSLMKEYELRLTPLRTQLEESFLEQKLPLIELSISWRYDEQGNALAKGSNEQHVRGEAAQKRRNALLAETARMQEEIAKLNKRCALQFMDALGEPYARVLLSRFTRIAYWAVFEDRDQVFQLHESLKESAFEPDVLARIEELWSLYELGYQNISKTMQDRFDLWNRKKAETNQFVDYSTYVSEMRSLRESRWQRSKRFLQELRGVTPVEPGDANDATIERLVSSLEEVRKSGENDRFPYN